MIIFQSVMILALLPFAYAGTGQGIEPNDENLTSKEVAEAVKQEVYLKTANAEPIQIDRVKRFETRGIGSGVEAEHSLRRTPELGEVTKAPRIGYGIQSQPAIGRGAGTVAGTPGIGAGASGAGGYNPGIYGGVKIGGKEPAIGSGVVDDIADVGIGQGVQTTRRTWHRLNEAESKQFDDLLEGRGDSVVLESDKDHLNTVRGDKVSIGSGIRANRVRRQQFDRFDTGYARECNSYYGKVICYRVYTNPSISTPSEYTCWRVSAGRKNCTEIDNIVYLKNQGFQPDEYEVSRPQSRQFPKLRPLPQENDDVLRGQSGYYDPYGTASSRHNSPKGSSHRYVTSTLKLGRDNSLELDDDRELYREKRAIKQRKPYYIPPDYEIIDEYEQYLHKHKPKPTKVSQPL